MWTTGKTRFLSTLSLRRATRTGLTCGDGRNISIHALLAESDGPDYIKRNKKVKFLSTLSLRRATISCAWSASKLGDFYPRSPCGERPGSDRQRAGAGSNFYPRSPCGERPILGIPNQVGTWISIHALLAESDYCHCFFWHLLFQFLSTLSLRRATGDTITRGQYIGISIHALLAESDPISTTSILTGLLFLSTLSLRRATDRADRPRTGRQISIHALLAESDPHSAGPWQAGYTISIHALLAESDDTGLNFGRGNTIFLSTLSLRRATIHYDNYNLHCVISIHALLAESDIKL